MKIRKEMFTQFYRALERLKQCYRRLIAKQPLNWWLNIKDKQCRVLIDLY